MLTFFLIPDKEKFFDLTDRSCGEVLLHLPDGSVCDLKRNCLARELLRVMEPGRAGLRVSLSSQCDTAAFIQYMQEACLPRAQTTEGR